MSLPPKTNPEFPGSQAEQEKSDYPCIFKYVSETKLRYFHLSADGLKETVTPASTTNQAYIPSLDWTKTRNETPEFHLLTATGDGSTAHQPLSLSKEDFSRLCAEWHLPPKLLRHCHLWTTKILENNILEFSIQEQHVAVKDNMSPGDMSLPVPRLLTIVCLTGLPPAGTVCILSCDLRVRASSRCLITGTDAQSIAEILSDINANAGDVLLSPEAILGIIFMAVWRDIDNLITDESRRSHQLAARLGILSPWRRGFLAEIGYTNAVDQDYEGLNVDIYEHENVLNLLRLRLDKAVMLAHATVAMVEYTDKSRSTAAFEYLNDAIRWLEMLKPDLEYWSMTVRNQGRVLFQLVNQRDSRLNYSVARSSRQIAAASRRDSSAMKTISILTLVFLPGTFVSAIASLPIVRKTVSLLTSSFLFLLSRMVHANGDPQFSTQIFDFSGPDAGYGRVSKAWWIYLLCSLLLTLVTIGIWAVWTVWRLNKAVADEEREMAELEREDAEAQRRNKDALQESNPVVPTVMSWSTGRSVDSMRHNQRSISRRSNHSHSVASVLSWHDSGQSQRSNTNASGFHGRPSSMLGSGELEDREKSPSGDYQPQDAPKDGHGHSQLCSFRGSAPSLTTDPISATREAGEGPVTQP